MTNRYDEPNNGINLCIFNFNLLIECDAHPEPFD